MTTTKRKILDMYRIQLKHYFDKGFGEKGDEDYVEGSDVLNIDIETYNEFIEEIQAC